MKEPLFSLRKGSVAWLYASR